MSWQALSELAGNLLPRACVAWVRQIKRSAKSCVPHPELASSQASLAELCQTQAGDIGKPAAAAVKKKKNAACNVVYILHGLCYHCRCSLAHPAAAAALLPPPPPDQPATAREACCRCSTALLPPARMRRERPGVR